MPAPNYFERNEPVANTTPTTSGNDSTSNDKPYYNPRLDPKNYMQGPLSDNAATRLRQMLARPGIVVSDDPAIILPSTLNVDHKVAPGICDGISARCALEAGFDCLYQR